MNRFQLARFAPIFILSLLSALPVFSDSFHVAINTSTTGLNLQGPGVLAFELSDGPTTSDVIKTAISSFNLDAGSPGSVIASQGVTGSFTGGSTALTIQNGVSFGAPTQTSFYEQNVNFGSEVSLSAAFTFTPPVTGPADATSDFLIVLGPADFPVTQINAVDLIRSADGGLTLQFADPAAVTITTTTTPEPVLLAPFGLLLLSLVLWRRRAV